MGHQIDFAESLSQFGKIERKTDNIRVPKPEFNFMAIVFCAFNDFDVDCNSKSVLLLGKPWRCELALDVNHEV